MQFTINLATRTYIDRRLVSRISAVLFAVLLAAAAWNINRAAWNLGELRRLRSDIAATEQKLGARPGGVSEKEYARVMAEIGYYNGIISRKAFNWLGLLEQLELATPEGIALASFVPDRSKGALKIEGRARSFAQVRAYLDKLEDSGFFTSILLLSHTGIAAGERSRGVQFTISCKAAQL